MKGYTLSSTRSCGKLAIWGWTGGSASYLHLIQVALILGNAIRCPIAQKRCWSRLLTYSIALWCFCSCICLGIRTTTGGFAERKNWIFQIIISFCFAFCPIDHASEWCCHCQQMEIVLPNRASLSLHSDLQVSEQFGKAFKLNHLRHPKLGFLSFQWCHNATLLWSKSKALNNHVIRFSLYLLYLDQSLTLSVGVVMKRRTSSYSSFVYSSQLPGLCFNQASPSTTRFPAAVTQSLLVCQGLPNSDYPLHVAITCLDWSKSSSTRLAINKCCFLRDECSYSNAVIKSVQRLTLWIYM